MAVALTVQEDMKRSSWIRKMFEIGRALKEEHGEDNVFDFSLGSPSLEPPAEFLAALAELTQNPRPGMHRYMPNNGYLSTRAAVAERLSRQEQLEVDPDDVLMTVGAAGAINVAMTSLLDPGDEVIVLAPYFAEYLFYVKNHAGVARVVETTEDFRLDIAAIEEAITAKTKAIIINTPNNPTGRIYSAESLAELAETLTRASQRHGRPIHLLVDTPYARITYDDHRNPPFFPAYPSTIIAHSYSKDLGLAGQRIGYLAINPRSPDRQALRGACTFTNRTLGFINAPALMQLALERSLDACVDIDQYKRLKARLCTGLTEAGYDFFAPQGAFYVFPRSPIPDDVAFTKELQKENVLVVPGAGFGRPGHVRVAFCVQMDAIERALPRFAKVMERVR